MKNGSELLDRLVKDIVSESASTYVSVLQTTDEALSSPKSSKASIASSSTSLPTAFSLARFIPLLKERIYVINPFTRTFLVLWINLLDSIPDLELVHYLPAFLGGLINFLNDGNKDVYVATQGVLEQFLNEIKKVARIKRGLAESRKESSGDRAKDSDSSDSASIRTDRSLNEKSGIVNGEDGGAQDEKRGQGDDDWVPGQDVQVDHSRILEILVAFLDPASGKYQFKFLARMRSRMVADDKTKLTALRWIDTFFEICPEDILAFVPRLLSQVLPAMASGSDLVRQDANRVNHSLMDHIASLPDENIPENTRPPPPSRIPTGTLKEPTGALKEADSKARRSSTPTPKPPQANEADCEVKKDEEAPALTPPSSSPTQPKPVTDLDYTAAVGSLTLHFLNEHEATRVAALGWLIMLHKKAPQKVLATNDGTFPALLKTLSDPAENVVTRDLQLLSQISKNSEDGYFTSFMVNLLQLFATDRKLLETRGNLIIRQLCVSLSAERIYRTLADCLEKDEVTKFHCVVLNFSLLRSRVGC